MAVPKFHEFFFPVLKAAAIAEQTLPELRQFCGNFFQLSAEDRDEKTKGEKKSRFEDRVQWACTYLVQAGLLERPKRGVVKITSTGKTLLKSGADKITLDDLEKYDSFAEFKNRSSARIPKNDVSNTPNNTPSSFDTSPTERLEGIISEANGLLASELLKNIIAAGDSFFEQLVLDLIQKMGYGVGGKTTPRSRDGGIDGVIQEDRLGLSEIYLQAKLWENNVGRPAIQQFIGALSTTGTQKGIFITNSDFTKDARECAKRAPQKVILINGMELVEYMISHNVGVQIAQLFELKKIDLDYFQR